MNNYALFLIMNLIIFFVVYFLGLVKSKIYRKRANKNFLAHKIKTEMQIYQAKLERIALFGGFSEAIPLYENMKLVANNISKMETAKITKLRVKKAIKTQLFSNSESSRQIATLTKDEHDLLINFALTARIIHREYSPFHYFLTTTKIKFTTYILIGILVALKFLDNKNIKKENQENLNAEYIKSLAVAV